VADERVAAKIVLVDAVTTANQAVVDASGRVAVALASSAATVTVDTTYDYAEDSAHSTGDFGAFVLSVRDDDPPASTATASGDYAALVTDADGRLYVNIHDGGNTITVDGSVGVSSVSGMVQIGDGTDAVDVLAAGADDVSNTNNELITAALLYGFDGTGWDRVYTVADGDAVAAGTKGFLLLGTDGSNYQVLKTDANGELQVDVLTGGGVDAPTNPVNDYNTSTDLAAGSTANHDTVDFGAATKKLTQVIASASVAFKIEVGYSDNSVLTTLAVGFGQAGNTVSLSPTHPNYWSHAFTANAGFDGFRVVMTNLDTSQAADSYCTLQYCD